MEAETEEMIQNRNDIIYLKRAMTEIKRVVKGYNGNTGLVGHAEKTDLSLELLRIGQGEIKKLLIGDIADKEDAGLKGGQRDLRKMQASITRFFWIVLGVFISGTGGLIFYTAQLKITAANLP